MGSVIAYYKNMEQIQAPDYQINGLLITGMIGK